MQKYKLSTMDVGGLVQLRKSVQTELEARRKSIVWDLAALGSAAVQHPGQKSARRAPNGMRGRKVPPKYRGPHGETWAGRGAKPRWMTALLKAGKKMESFRIKQK